MMDDETTVPTVGAVRCARADDLLALIPQAGRSILQMPATGEGSVAFFNRIARSRVPEDALTFGIFLLIPSECIRFGVGAGLTIARSAYEDPVTAVGYDLLQGWLSDSDSPVLDRLRDVVSQGEGSMAEIELCLALTLFLNRDAAMSSRIAPAVNSALLTGLAELPLNGRRQMLGEVLEVLQFTLNERG